MSPALTAGDGPFTGVTVQSWGGLEGRTLLCDVNGDTVITVTRDLTLHSDGPAQILDLEVIDVPGIHG